MWIVHSRDGEQLMVNIDQVTKIERDHVDIILYGQPVYVKGEMDVSGNAVSPGIECLEFDNEEKAKRAFYKIFSCLADGNINILNLSEEKNATEFSINTKN